MAIPCPSIIRATTRGAAYREFYKLEYRRKTGKYASIVRELTLEVRAGDGASTEPRLESSWEYVLEHVPASSQRTIASFMLLTAQAFDSMRAGLWLEAEDDVAKLLVAGEQAALDSGD